MNGTYGRTDGRTDGQTEGRTDGQGGDYMLPRNLSGSIINLTYTFNVLLNGKKKLEEVIIKDVTRFQR